MGRSDSWCHPFCMYKILYLWAKNKKSTPSIRTKYYNLAMPPMLHTLYQIRKIFSISCPFNGRLPYTCTIIPSVVSKTHSIKATVLGSHLPKLSGTKFLYLLSLITDFVYVVIILYQLNFFQFILSRNIFII